MKLTNPNCGYLGMGTNPDGVPEGFAVPYPKVLHKFAGEFHVTDKKLNRMTTNFPYTKMTEAVMRKAYKEGVGVKPVWPAHTSTIGYKGAGMPAL